MSWGKKVPIQWADDPLELCKGWTEIWEGGKFLGLFDGLSRLEKWICARPGREFVGRFIQRPIGCRVNFMRPIGSFGLKAGENGRAAYYHLERKGD